jgi:hypothetical protein
MISIQAYGAYEGAVTVTARKTNVPRSVNRCGKLERSRIAVLVRLPRFPVFSDTFISTDASPSHAATPSPACSSGSSEYGLLYLDGALCVRCDT